MSAPEMLYVTWLDSTGADGWAERGEVSQHAPALIESVGFVVVDTDTHLTLSLALTDNGHTCGAFMVIPKGAIRASYSLQRVLGEAEDYPRRPTGDVGKRSF